MKVLVVDDNESIRDILRESLEIYSTATVIEACDGVEGFDLARTQRPDLIISDAQMPRLDGFQFLHQLKADEELKSIPFIFYSAIYTGSKDEELALSLGAEAFIAKPMAAEEFMQELSVILNRLEAGEKSPVLPVRLANEEDYLREYSGVVADKLADKVRELEVALAQRVTAEEALRSQFNQFSTIFDALNALVYVADLKTDQILFMNRYGGALFGPAWIGKTCAEVFHPQAGEYWGQCSSDMLVRDGIPQQPQMLEFLSPVSGRWYQGVDRAISWTDGRLVRLQIAFDITERKELERIKDEMVSAVSHEMRTPLTAMLGYMEFMLSNELSLQQLHEYLGIVNIEAGRLNKLIGNFLDFQQQRARGSALTFHPVAIRPLMEEAIATQDSARATHRLSVDCPADLPAVLGDESLLQRMFEVLVSNAVKYSPDGGEVRLSTAVVANDVQIQVSDEGVGIPTEELEHIFEMFYRVDNTDRRPFGGTGLGLALVREIALGHRGRVWVESRVGQGSTFYVALPAYHD